jgi:hypothetical protein
VTLKPEDVASRAGTELLNLCTTITEDGSLLDDEIKQLRDWLQQNQDAPIPAITFLCELVTRILSDNKVTSAERSQLNKALERVLPKELRDIAVKHRRNAELESWKEYLGKRPDQTFDFMVAGVLHERRAKQVKGHARTETPIYLVREPLNAYSRNAVKVVLENGAMIGYVPEEDATTLAPLLDSGYKQKAWVKKILDGRRAPIPIVVAELYSGDRMVAGARVVSDGLPHTTTQAPSGRGCLTISGASAIVVLFMVLKLVS